MFSKITTQIYVRKKTNDYIEKYAYQHKMSKIDALEHMIRCFRSIERKEEIKRLSERMESDKSEN